MNQFYLTLCFLVFGASVAFAQPANDDCVDAEVLTDVIQFCANYDPSGYTFDAAGSDCGPALSPPNMWFSFVANGSILDLTVESNTAGERIMINVFAVDPNDPCNTLTNIFCTTSGIINNLTGLNQGDTYYFSVSITDGDGVSSDSPYELCINSGDAQTNSDPCQPTGLVVGGCLPLESNILASTEINLDPLCPVASESQLWYTVSVNAPNHILELTLNTAGADPISGDVFMMVGAFEAGCQGGFTFIDFYCGPPNSSYEFFGLTPGQTYYVGVATNQDNEGTFEICAQELGPDACALQANECGPTAPTLTPMSPVAGDVPVTVCQDGCVDNATPFTDFSFTANCGFEFNNSSVWYNIQTDATAVTMNIEISNTGGFEEGAAALIEYDCAGGPPTIIACNLGNALEVQLIDVNVNPNTNYALVITDIEDNFGTFELCVNTLPPIMPCNRVFSIYENSSDVDDSPIGGPYCPGEEVEFCIEVTTFEQDATNCQWLQAIIPYFGEGWDPVSFDAEGMPTVTQNITPLGGGSWGWYPDNDVDFNVGNPQIHVTSNVHGLHLCSPLTDFDCMGTPLANGVGLPRGWYAVAPDPTPPNDHPDNSYGDGTGCGSTIGPWTICFSVTARSHPDCSSPVTFSDASVGVMIFADGETGSWQAQDCIGQLPEIVSASIACDETPEILADDAEICSGQSFIVQLTSPQDPLIYEWTADAPPSIQGASDGTGSVISQTLTNTGSAPADVVYNITGRKTACPGLEDVTVTVYPEITVQPINQPEQGCALQSFGLGNYIQINGGKPPYSYSWSNGETTNNPQVQLNADATFSVTVTDEVGCQGVGTVTIEIFDVYDVQIDGPASICLSDVSATLTATPLGGNMPHGNYDWQLPDGSVLTDAGETIEADQSGTYIVTVRDAGNCPGTGEFEFTIFDEPEPEILAFPDGPICVGSTVQLFESVIPGSGTSITTSWITPPDFMGDVSIPGFETDVPGDYTLIAIDENGCVDSFTMTLDVQDAPDASPASIEICFEPSGSGTFDLTTVESVVNNGTSFDVDFYVDIDLTMPISNLDQDNYISGPGTIYAVVLNDADCASSVVPITLSFTDEIAAQDTSQTVCLESNGMGTFDLTVLIESINNGSGLDVNFYEDNTGSVQITDPSSYVSGEGTVFAQVDGGNGCFSDFASITLVTDTLLDAFAAQLEVCRTADGTGVFDLTTQNSVVNGGAGTLDVIWYSAVSPLTPISDPTMFETSANVVWATVSDGVCIANIVEVDLSTVVSVTGDSIDIVACNRGDNTGRFNLTDSDETIGGSDNTVTWYNDMDGTDAIGTPEDFESGATVVYAVIETPERCASEPIPVSLSLEFLDVTDIDSVKTCDPGTGIGEFDLTSQDGVINGGGGATVEWYEDMALSQEIADPAAFSSSNTTVYARIVDGECVSEPIDVILAVTNDLFGQAIVVTGCDQGNGMHAFDLTTQEILISPDGLDVEFFTDAAATVPVADASNYMSGDGTIYAVVRDGVCRSPIVAITLEVVIDVFPPLETVVECDEGGGVGSFDLTSYVDLVDLAGTGSVQWFEDAAGTTPIADPTNISSTPTVVYFRLTTAEGCISDITAFTLDTDNNLPAFPAAAEACDDGTGNGTFNLELLLATIHGGNGYDVQFYRDIALSDQIISLTDFASGAVTIYAVTIDGPCQSLPVEVDLSLIDPIVATPTSLDLCDEGTGTATFDLATLEAIINNGQTHTVLWYEDAALTTPIADINAYISAGGIVYAVLSNGNCESDAVEVDLSITTITGQQINIETCDEGAGTGTFDLLANAGSIATGGETITWYADAGLTNEITDVDAYVSSGGSVFAVLSDGRCDSEPIEISLTLTDKLPAAIVSLADCDDGDGILSFNLQAQEDTINTGGSGDVVWYENADGTNVIMNETDYQSGTVTVYAQVVDGPCRSDIIPITLTVSELPVVDAGESKQLDCRAEFLDINGVGPSGDFTVSWTTADGNIISADDQLDIQVDMAGTYVLEVVNNVTGCSTTDEVVITEDTNLPVADAGLDAFIDCFDEMTEIGTANTSTGSNITISWTLNNQTIPGNDNIISVGQEGTYVLQVENTETGCTNTDTVDVQSAIADLTNAQVDLDHPNCNGVNTGCVTLLSVEGGEAPYSLSVNGSPFDQTDEICALAAGQYTLTVRDANGCETSETFTINEPEVLTVEIVGDNLIDYNGSGNLAAVHSPQEVEISTYDWISDNHVSTAIDSIVEIQGLTEFTVQVIITDENGCTAEDEINIYVRKDFKVYAPNAFSPSSSGGINDRFMLYGDENIVTNVDQLRIYSRWGEKLFERKDLTINDVGAGWDGTKAGERMLPGPYVYYANVTFVDGTTELIQGEVMLVE